MRKFIQSTTYCFEKVIKKSLKQPEKSAQRNRRKHDIRAVEGLFENVLSLYEKKKKKTNKFSAVQTWLSNPEVTLGI